MTTPPPDLRPFLLERWFAAHEFAVPHALSASDCQPLSARHVMDLAGMDPRELLELPLAYTQSRGDPALRDAIARCYPGCAPDDVLVCNAPQEAIFLLMHALLRPGDRVVVQTPCYQSLAELPRSLGAELVPWPVRLYAGEPELDLDHLAALLNRPTALLVTNAPHNPTGAHPAQERWRSIATLVQASGTRWFSDEMYRGLCPQPQQELEPAAAMVHGAVSLWGTSKSFGLPGIRIGWLCSRDRALLARVEERKDYTTICNSAPGEVLARAALRAADPILRRNRERIAANATLMTAFAAKRPDLLRWQPPQAGPVALAEVRGETATALADRVRAHGALLVPSALFDLDDRWVRIGLGRDHFAEALACWQAAGARP